MAAQTPVKILKAPPIPAPTGRRPIGFRGNHQHKKALYDPVYRTTKVPSNLVPRYPIDWRNGGRALLVAALHKLEGNHRFVKNEQHLLQCQRPLNPGSLVAAGNGASGCCSLEELASMGRRRGARAGSAASAASKRLLLRHKRSLQWQEGGFCSDRCGATCNKSPWRCLCAWRCRGFFQHVNRMDAILMRFKGNVEPEKPLFAVKKPQVAPSRFASEGMAYCKASSKFISTAKQLHPAFVALDTKQTNMENAKQRSISVCWGMDDDLNVDSDAEDDVDEEADDFRRFLSGIARQMPLQDNIKDS